MYQVVCTDLNGVEHEISADQMTLRTSVHTIYITEGKVLLTLDASSKHWEYPGGFLQKDEKYGDVLRQAVAYQTGVTIGYDSRLASIIEEDFFDLYENIGYHLTKMYYTVKSVTGGTLLENGNGQNSLAAHFFTLKEVEKFSDKEMKRRYREILKGIQ